MIIQDDLENDITVETPSLYPATFDFKNTAETSVIVFVKDNKDLPLTKIPLSIYAVFNGEKHLLENGITSSDGELAFTREIGNHIDSLSVETPYIGLVNESLIVLEGRKHIELNIGGKTSYQLQGQINPANSATSRTAATFNFLGSFDNLGVPHYLEPIDDYIFQDMLDLINNSLPESYPVPQYHPEYLADDVSSDTKLKDSAEVWVTFVHEGAGWTNTLGYYTYDLNNPPTTAAEIANLTVIFPNTSFIHSGGGLSSGNKVSLGRFSANTGIGWFLVPQGWSGGTVVERSQIKYSNKDFNTFTQPQYRTHTVLLKDLAREVLLLGIEDTSRPGGDNDFNDAVFYVSANPFSALIIDDLQETTADTSVDTDGDGVSDKNDNYPDDANKAFDIYTPEENVFGSLAFEDLWPSKGDFDVNDMIIENNFQSIANVSKQVVEIRAKFKLKALGGVIHNGFGFELPISSDLIESISGQQVEASDEIQLAANGTELGQNNAVILVFDDGFRVWSGAQSKTNTISENAYIEPLEIDMVIKFKQPISIQALGYAPYNPFIFQTGERGVEIHLIDGTPTDKADLTYSYNGNEKSVSNPYKTTDNLPWGISLPVSFDYPEENESVSTAYNYFNQWAASNGNSYKDWYVIKSNYRNTNKIYNKK